MSLWHAMSAAASGTSAYGLWLEVLAGNLANLSTTRTPEGGPYRRKFPIFAALADGRVAVLTVAEDPSPPVYRYEPGHPDAGPDGRVAYPRIDPAREMADLMIAMRGYEASVAAFDAARQAARAALGILA